jgi:hypothetical protein
MRVLAPAAKPGVATELGPQTDGFLPIDHAANAEKYRSDFEDFQRKKPGGRNVDHPNRNAFAQLAHDIRASGATPFFVVTPTTTRDFQARKDAPEGEALFAFDDPVEFPILYELDCRLDSDHLNAKGATELTRALAERFAHSCAKTH